MYSHTTYFGVVTTNVILTFDPIIFYPNFEFKRLDENKSLTCGINLDSSEALLPKGFSYKWLW